MYSKIFSQHTERLYSVNLNCRATKQIPQLKEQPEVECGGRGAEGEWKVEKE